MEQRDWTEKPLATGLATGGISFGNRSRNHQQKLDTICAVQCSTWIATINYWPFMLDISRKNGLQRWKKKHIAPSKLASEIRLFPILDLYENTVQAGRSVQSRRSQVGLSWFFPMWLVILWFFEEKTGRIWFSMSFPITMGTYCKDVRLLQTKTQLLILIL